MSCGCKPQRRNCFSCASRVDNVKVNPCNCRGKSRCGACIDGNRVVVKEINKMSGINTAVIDDANELTYFYGNVQHENFHVPDGECQPYVVVPTNWDTYRQFIPVTAVYEGAYPNNTIELDHVPSDVRHIYVFLNGVHQDEGAQYDYIFSGKSLEFLDHTLIPTDRVTVKYHYVEVES